MLFKTKKNFSIVDSPGKRSLLAAFSPRPRIDPEVTPAKRIRVSSPLTVTPVKKSPAKIEKSPERLSFIGRFESKDESFAEAPRRVESGTSAFQTEIAKLREKIIELDAVIAAKFNQIQRKKEQIDSLSFKRLQYEDSVDLALKVQTEVRDILNDAYNPGEELARRVGVITEDARKSHSKKFEKFSYEMDRHLTRSEKAAKELEARLSHELELHKRTLVTMQAQRSRPAPSTPQTMLPQPQPIQQTPPLAEAQNSSSDPIPEIEIVNISEDNNEVVDDEATDIDDERSFTPCQAQKPLSGQEGKPVAL